MLNILTDRGIEYRGKVEYQLYSATNDIDHKKTKAVSSQTNGWFTTIMAELIMGNMLW
mgnify:FL=1